MKKRERKKENVQTDALRKLLEENAVQYTSFVPWTLGIAEVVTRPTGGIRNPSFKAKEKHSFEHI